MSKLLRSFNAMKHGGYSNLGVLPGEDAKEFDCLHQGLIHELAPSGPTEDDIVLGLAKCMWRKYRLSIYAQAAEERERWAATFEDRDHLLWDFKLGLARHFTQLSERIQKLVERDDELRKAWVKDGPQFLQFKKTTAALMGVDPEDQELEQELLQEVMVGLRLAALGEHVTPEALAKEIELLGRLDARIDRLLKRLFQVKAAKEMIGLGSGWNDASSQAPKLASPQT